MDFKFNYAVELSGGPHVVNLQMHTWRRALLRLRRMTTEANESAEYGPRDFLCDAAEVVVLAGTSVSQLLGQNVEPTAKKRTPDPVDAFKQIAASHELKGAGFDSDIVPRFVSAMKLYADIRHFGKVKHGAADELDEKRLCEFMQTVQQVWQAVVVFRRGLPARDACAFPAYLRNTFSQPIA